MNNSKPANELLTIPAMLDIVLANIASSTSTENLKLTSNLLNRVVAKDIYAPRSLPVNNIATMDGYCLHKNEKGKKLKIVGFASAGSPFIGEVENGTCIKIATGAWVSHNLDLVVPWEEVKVTDDEILISEDYDVQNNNIRPKGSEVAIDDLVVAKGKLLTSLDIAHLKNLGVDRIAVYTKPTIGVLSTGDELIEFGSELKPGAIYDANRPLILAELGKLAVNTIDLKIVKDNYDELVETLNYASSSCDLIITSGGASVGERDLIKQVLQDKGELNSWKVAVKPGKPFLIGKFNITTILGLPGNPASAYITYLLFVYPAIMQLMNAKPIPELITLKAKFQDTYNKRTKRAEYLRAILTKQNGDNVVTLAGEQGSASTAVLARTNCLIHMPIDKSSLEQNEDVEVVLINHTI